MRCRNGPKSDTFSATLPRLYAWDTSAAGIYGQFVKPVLVNESEFRLVDRLYNVGEVVGAPNGNNLSICYEQVLNNLVPGQENDSRIMVKQQDQIRRRLMKDVPAAGWVRDLIESQHKRSASLAAAVGSLVAPSGDTVPMFAVANRLTDEGKVNRMELVEALMEESLAAKQVWELERDAMIKNARAKNEDMEDVTPKLAHITSIREAQLAAKQADAVVRGYPHTIRQYLGYMDIKSPAEMLQDAKDAFREAPTSSLDGALNIYPVQMSPIDWFQSLSTSFTSEDLTSDPEIIFQQINAKSRLLDTLQARLATLQLAPKNDLKALQSAVEQAQSAYTKAQSDLQKTYTSNIISLAQSFVSAANVFQYGDFVKQATKFNILESAFTGIEAAMNKTTTAHEVVNSASRAHSQALSAVTLAEATDTAQEITAITLQMDAVRKEITELTTRVQALRGGPVQEPADPPPKLEETPLFPPPASGTTGGSRWQEIMRRQISTKSPPPRSAPQFPDHTSASSGAQGNKAPRPPQRMTRRPIANRSRLKLGSEQRWSLLIVVDGSSRSSSSNPVGSITLTRRFSTRSGLTVSRAWTTLGTQNQRNGRS